MSGVGAHCYLVVIWRAPEQRSDQTITHSTIKGNVPGAAMMAGSGNTIEHNCLTGNGQYAFNAYQNPGDPQESTVTGGPQNIVLSDNEISYNNRCNWEAFSKFPGKTPAGCAGAGQFDGCGCSGGGKFWQDQNVTVQDNYVHDNYGVGIWADTNNDGSTSRATISPPTARPGRRPRRFRRRWRLPPARLGQVRDHGAAVHPGANRTNDCTSSGT